MLRHYINMSCQDDDPDAGARQLLGGKPGPKPPPKSRAGGGTSPLHLASCRGHVGVVHELLIAGADATRGDQFGYSALHLAAKHGFPDVITELLSFSAVDVDLPDESGETALHTAARYAKTMCMSRLLKHGSNIDVLSRSGRRAADVVGQAQDKHNLQSLPHSATQLAGTGVSRRSHKFNTNMPPAQLPRDKCTEERIRRLLRAAASGRKDGWMWPDGMLVDPGDADAATAACCEDEDDIWDWDPAAFLSGCEDGDAVVSEGDSEEGGSTAEGAVDDAAGAHATRCGGEDEGATAAAVAGTSSTTNATTAAAQEDGKANLSLGCDDGETTAAAVAVAVSPASAAEVLVTAMQSTNVAGSSIAPSDSKIPAKINGSGAGAPQVSEATAAPAAAGGGGGSGADAAAAGADAAAGGATVATAATDAPAAAGAGGGVEAAPANDTRSSGDGGSGVGEGEGEGGADGPTAAFSYFGEGDIVTDTGTGTGTERMVVGNGSACGGRAAAAGMGGEGAGDGAVAAEAAPKALPVVLGRLNVRRLVKGRKGEGNPDVFKALNRYTYTSPTKPGLAPRAR